ARGARRRARASGGGAPRAVRKVDTRPPRPPTVASSAPPRSGAPRGRPRGTQILAHVERAAHLIAVHFADKRQVDGITVLLAVCASDPDAVAVDRASDFAGHELTLMEAAEIVALLSEVKRVRRRRRRILNLHVPLTGQIQSRCRRRIRVALCRWFRQHGDEAIGDDLLVARSQHVWRDAHACLTALRTTAGGVERNPRVAVEQDTRDCVSARRDLLAVPENRQRWRAVRQAVRLI